MEQHSLEQRTLSTVVFPQATAGAIFHESIIYRSNLVDCEGDDRIGNAHHREVPRDDLALIVEDEDE